MMGHRELDKNDMRRLRRFHKHRIKQIGESFDQWLACKMDKIDKLGVKQTLKLEDKSIQEMIKLTEAMNSPASC